MEDFDKSKFDPKAAAEARKKEMEQMAKYNLERFLNQQEEEQKQKEKQQSKSGQSL